MRWRDLKQKDTGSRTERQRERKGTGVRAALEEETNCDGQLDREMEKEKVEREREERRGSQLDRGIQ